MSIQKISSVMPKSNQNKFLKGISFKWFTTNDSATKRAYIGTSGVLNDISLAYTSFCSKPPNKYKPPMAKPKAATTTKKDNKTIFKINRLKKLYLKLTKIILKNLKIKL